MRPSKLASSKGSSSARPSCSSIALAEAGGRRPGAALGEHLRALVDADDPAAVAAGELDRDRGRPAGDVEDGVAGPGLDARDEERAPARVLAEAEQARVAVVGLRQRREELARGAVPLRGWGGHGAIVAPREPRGGAERRRRGRAGARADGEELVAVIPTEPGTGARVYLCAYERGGRALVAGARRRGRPIADRVLVRDAVAIAAMSSSRRRAPAAATSGSSARGSSSSA